LRMAIDYFPSPTGKVLGNIATAPVLYVRVDNVSNRDQYFDPMSFAFRQGGELVPVPQFCLMKFTAGEVIAPGRYVDGYIMSLGSQIMYGRYYGTIGRP